MEKYCKTVGCGAELCKAQASLPIKFVSFGKFRNQTTVLVCVCVVAGDGYAAGLSLTKIKFAPLLNLFLFS